MKKLLFIIAFAIVVSCSKDDSVSCADAEKAVETYRSQLQGYTSSFNLGIISLEQYNEAKQRARETVLQKIKDSGCDIDL